MKTSRFATLVMVGLALSFTPALAQRGGGGTRGGGSHSSSSSVSRSSSPSSSSRGSSFSSPSRSSSSSSISRSSSSPSISRSTSSPSVSRNTSSAPSRNGVRAAERGSVSPARTTTPDRSPAVRSAGANRGVDRSAATRATTTRHGDAPAATRRATAGSSSHGTPVHSNPAARNSGYARPGHPGGVMPPSARPIHPAPYFHHPWHGYVVHCHPIYWHPVPPRPWYWPGFWHYCHSYWYDYHVTDVVVVRQYVQDTYKVDMVTYGISGDIMYAIVRDGGDTYLQVYDKDDHLLAEQKIHKKYCNMVIDADNGGAWISKKGNKDALLFIWADGQLLIYEAD